MRHIAHITVVVHDYDEAIAFYTRKLGFELIEDTLRSLEKRWVLVKPSGSDSALLLAKAATDAQRAVVGNQTGGRVFLFLYTDNFWADYTELLRKGISFVRPPQKHDYGWVAVFTDLYGNLWDLLQPLDIIPTPFQA